MEKKVLDLLKNVPIFIGADEKILSSMIEIEDRLRSYDVGEEIPAYENGDKNLVLIIEGKANVFSQDVERSVLLRTLSKGDIFGVAELFGDGNSNISRVEAKSKCSVLFIPKEKISQLLEYDKQIMHNYLDFLSCRIRFLNKRIACFTAGSAERRLAFYLNSLVRSCEKENETVTVTPHMSMGALALMLDIGRASLYRAVDTLTEDGFIRKSGKSFVLNDRQKMLRNYNK